MPQAEHHDCVLKRVEKICHQESGEERLKESGERSHKGSRQWRLEGNGDRHHE